jgi:hypothetical protein
MNLKEFAETIETGEERNYTVADVFPEYAGKGQQVAIRAYRYRENLTQRQMAALTKRRSWQMSPTRT